MNATATAPAADLRTLDRLVGTWGLGAGTAGTVTFEWINEGHFLRQRFDLTLHDHRVTGFEIIGHWRHFGQAPDPTIRSRAYDAEGNTFDYVYDLDGDTLTIWAGERDGAAFYRGTFSPDGRVIRGRWTYPGGGYESTMTRQD